MRAPRTPASLVRLFAPLIGGLLAAAALSGCSAAEDAVNQATDDAKNRASSAAVDLAAQAVRQQICALVSDGRLSEADLQKLRDATAQAEAVGLPAEIGDQARALIESGRTGTNAQVQELQESCKAP
jgi:hypothetical protein